ncbi:fasciclin domain-containing protein [Parasphingorhabdus sp.]|uniref:fasciclin domain-containing protein n=1 Tax=Parasphingorhabdus sp. TaxID=2709688 RepID=UPI0035942207
MFNAPKIIFASTLLAMVPACSSELNEEEQEILDARIAEDTKPTNMIAVLQANPDLSTAGILLGLSGVGAELQDKGPVTAFAATNDAFNKMDATRLSELLSADNKEELKSIAEYGLVEGNMTAADIAKAITDGGGSASLTTEQGGVIKATMDGDRIVLENAAGNKANVTQADVTSSNGTLHVVDNLLMPE